MLTSARRLLPAVLGLALCQAEPLFGLTLGVSPVGITLGPKAQSSLLTLTNQGDHDVRFEVSVFAWAEDESGEMKLTPTDDLVVFPLLSSVPARSQKIARIGLAHRAPTAVEKAYRVFIEEMPGPQTEAEGGKVLMQMRVGIPVFFAPARPSGSAVLQDAALEGGRLRFRLANPGNAHVRLSHVRVTTEGGADVVAAEHELPAWYLLPGGARAYDLALDPKECSGARSFRVDATGPGVTVSTRVEAPANGCK